MPLETGFRLCRRLFANDHRGRIGSSSSFISSRVVFSLFSSSAAGPASRSWWFCLVGPSSSGKACGGAPFSLQPCLLEGLVHIQRNVVWCSSRERRVAPEARCRFLYCAALKVLESLRLTHGVSRADLGSGRALLHRERLVLLFLGCLEEAKYAPTIHALRSVALLHVWVMV